MKFKPDIFLQSVGVVFVLWLVFVAATYSNESAFDRFGMAITGMFMGWPVTLVGLFLVYCGIYVYRDKHPKHE